MKTIPCYFVLLLISASCTSNSLNVPTNVKLWEVIEPNSLNKKLENAYKEKLYWSDKPELYIFNLLEISNLRKISYEYKTDNIESPKIIEIYLVRDGFLDDSVRGDIHHLKLIKGYNEKWKISSIRKATSCWRSNKLIYSSESCP